MNAMTPQAPSAPVRAYLEHVAIRVADIHWHIRFFRDVFGMQMREVEGPIDDPRQFWTLGGLQFVSTPGFGAEPSHEAGRLAHLGIMVDDLEAACDAAARWEGVTVLPHAFNWFQLPDGLAVELIQAAPGSVDAALAVKSRL